MQTQEIRIGQAIYELHRIYSGTSTVMELIREKLEADAAAIDADKRQAV